MPTTKPIESTGARRCPCGSGEVLDNCCGPLLDGIAPAPTAERLMRSRFTAFALGEPDYLIDSWHPRTRPRRLDLDPDQRWLSLEILGTIAGGPLDSEGVVEFRAHYRIAGRRGALQERSRFVRVDGRWCYLDGTHE
jgi:SEC-C motif domain protein